MKRKNFMVINEIIFFTFITASCAYGMRTRDTFSAEFKKKGYDIEVSWKQKKDILNVWGEVDSGKKCKQLNLSIFFSNSKDSGSGHVESAITEYDSSHRNRYKATDKVYVSSAFKENWHVSNIYINCLE